MPWATYGRPRLYERVSRTKWVTGRSREATKGWLGIPLGTALRKHGFTWRRWGRGSVGSIYEKRSSVWMTFLAVRKGFGPSTSGVTGPHSNQLNYRTSLFCHFLSKASANIGIFSVLANFWMKKLPKKLSLIASSSSPREWFRMEHISDQ